VLLDRLFGIFSNDLAIDLGTANTIVIAKGQGIIINEPSVVAIKKGSYGENRILAIGKDAKQMLGKTPESIKVIRPLKDGVISDFNATEEMIRFFIKKAHNRSLFIRPKVIIAIPYGLTQVERKAVIDSAKSAGAIEVILVEEPKAAAIGAGLPIYDPKGSMVIDIGGGTTEIGIISMGGLVSSKSIKVGGDRFDQEIISMLKSKYNLLIGENNGEKIKFEMGSAIEPEEEKKISIKGRDTTNGLLKEVEISSKDVRKAISKPLEEIADAIASVLEEIPPELAGDILENGIALTGGGALINGLDSYLSQKVKLPVYVAEDPLLSVAKGTGTLLENKKLLKQIAVRD